MISAGELYYLNMALDGTQIFGINQIESLISNEESEASPKESLIFKKILKHDEGLNEKSFKIISDLEKYKNAEKHIWVNDLLVSIDNTKYVVFLKNYKKGQFIFEKSTKELMLYNIVKNYPFLWDDIPVDSEKEIIEPRDFIVNKILSKESKNVLHIQKEKNEEFNICNIYYKEDYVYKYDVLNKALIKINPRDIRLELLKIFEIEVNK